MIYPSNPRQLKRTINSLNRQIEVLVRRLGMIAASDVIENKKLCEAYVEMINVRTVALRRCENLSLSQMLSKTELEENRLA